MARTKGRQDTNMKRHQQNCSCLVLLENFSHPWQDCSIVSLSLGSRREFWTVSNFWRKNEGTKRWTWIKKRFMMLSDVDPLTLAWLVPFQCVQDCPERWWFRAHQGETKEVILKRPPAHSLDSLGLRAHGNSLSCPIFFMSSVAAQIDQFGVRVLANTCNYTSSLLGMLSIPKETVVEVDLRDGDVLSMELDSVCWISAEVLAYTYYTWDRICNI